VDIPLPPKPLKAQIQKLENVSNQTGSALKVREHRSAGNAWFADQPGEFFEVPAIDFASPDRNKPHS
jgi:hypothetical protein